MSEVDLCAKRGCGDPADRHCRGMCEHHYRQHIRMGIFGWRHAEPARKHVLALRELGWTYEQLAEAAQVSTWVPHKLAQGQVRNIWPESERAILGLPLQPMASHRGVDSAGTRRRVQALAWMGWPAAVVAVRAGTTARTLPSLILPSRQVSFALAGRVKAVYDELWCLPGPSRIAAAKARQLGHAPPAAWDDETIDDPKARPRGIRATARNDSFAPSR